MSDYGQRMSGNNDLMDPDWKPDLVSPPVNRLVTLMKDIQDHFERYEDILNKHKDINWDTHQVSIPITKYNKDKILSIIERLK